MQYKSKATSASNAMKRKVNHCLMRLKMNRILSKSNINYAIEKGKKARKEIITQKIMKVKSKKKYCRIV
mgnify:CR=1 FL=1